VGDDGQAPPLRVLLCDDAAEMRALLRWALERGAVPVTIAGEAEDARRTVELAAELRPDAVVLDLQMPGMAPDELLRAVAAAAPEVPLVTFSGFDPDLVAPDEQDLITMHVPKTTDLAVVADAIVTAAAGGR
jgi:DNA-binding NarL/FixJ family response regulator